MKDVCSWGVGRGGGGGGVHLCILLKLFAII